MSGVRFEQVGYAYRPGAWVVRACSGAVAGGRVLAILGPNGRGKSTLLKLLLGTLRPLEGHVSIEGTIAFVPQLFDVAFGYSVLDMVVMGRARRLGLFAQPGARDVAAARAVLDRFGLADVARRPFHDLSGGQRQLVTLARALVAEARVLILDEPTSALDLRNQEIVLGWITHLARCDGLTVIMSSHHPQHALAVANYVLMMHGPGRYEFGAVRDVLTEPALRDLYGVKMRLLRVPDGEQMVDALVQIFPPTK